LGLLAAMPQWNSEDETIMKRTIPSSGETLPSIGIGTWQTFDVGANPQERAPLKDVLRLFIQKGGSVIDSSPMYGRSEKVVGELSAELTINQDLFIATKVWTTGLEAGKKQIDNSFSLLKKIDLLQIHNLLDWQTHLKTLHSLKEDGKIRYIGLTHYLDSTHDTLAEMIRNQRVDFIQINYNILDRHAENNLLPLAQEKKVAVLVNRPFEEGALFQKVRGKNVPDWARDFDCTSWAQFFLKFILSHPAITCVIPGTSKVTHLLDNLGGAKGKLPDEKQRIRMISFMEN
jgi:aryl-alcohol dehydrogenase-like predicted oxidoreductase